MLKIYHYSAAAGQEPFKDLQTKALSQKLSPNTLKEEREVAKEFHKVGAYCDHISFFFDPVPLDIIGELFGPWHHTWKPGNELYQYTVDVSTIADCPFEAVETPAALELLEKTVWRDDEEFKIDFFKRRLELQESLGEVGYTNAALRKVILRFKGSTREAYLKARKRGDWEENKTKYAASVPHLMIYPLNGIIRYEQVDVVKVGLAIATEAAPVSMRW